MVSWIISRISTRAIQIIKVSTIIKVSALIPRCHVRYASRVSSVSKKPLARDLFVKLFPTTLSRHTHMNQLLEHNRFHEYEQFVAKARAFKFDLSLESLKTSLRTLAQARGDPLSAALLTFAAAVTCYKHSKTVVEPILRKDMYWMCTNLLSTFSNCSLLELLAALNILHSKYIADVEDHNLHTLYDIAYVNTLVNSGQVNAATDYAVDVGIAPKALVNELIAREDCDTLLLFAQSGLVEYLEVLDCAMRLCHYPLVKAVYDHYIMQGFDNSTITTEQAITKYDNRIVHTLTDDIVHGILHILATNGDVDLTLGLIESHFLHKSLRGEKGLTKELCVKIIEAYCYHKDTDPTGDSDNSIKRTLDVINGFVVRKFAHEGVKLSYKEVATAFSHRIFHYRTVDSNIKQTLAHREYVADLIRNSEQNEWAEVVLPRKISNENIAVSRYGNVLANINTLKAFVSSHIEYLVEENAHKDTIQVFVNCVLSHINLYQNFSAAAQVLLVLHGCNPAFCTEWLDDDLLRILCNTLTFSSSAECSTVVAQYLMKTGKTDLVPLLLGACLNRGINHSCFQALLYEYFKHEGKITEEIEALLQRAIQVDPEVASIYGNILNGEVEMMWELHNLSKDIGEVSYKDLPTREYDARDAEYIRGVFDTT